MIEDTGTNSQLMGEASILLKMEHRGRCGVTGQVGQAQRNGRSAGRKIASRWLIAAVAAGGAGLSALPAMAQVPGAQRPAPQPQQQSPQAAARQAVSNAEIALLAAKADQQKVIDAVQQWFGQKPDFIAAAEKVKKAQADYDAAIKPVKQSVESSQEYQDLLSQKTDAQKTLDSASDPNGTVSDEDVSKAADVVVKSRLAMINMEADALNNDVKVAQTKAALKEAKDEMAALQQEVTDALATNPDYISTEKVVEQKQADLQQAETALEQQEKTNRPAPRPSTPRSGG
jgi:hypothetical protein